MPLNQVVASLAALVIHTPRKRKHIPIVTRCQFCRDERTALCRTLHHHTSITQSCYNTVSPHKIHLLRSDLRRVFRQQSPTPMHHLGCRLPMHGRVNRVQPMRQHTHRAHAVLQSRLVRTDVDAVCQATHNHRVGIVPLQVGNEVSAHVLAILRTLPCPHNVNDAETVQIGCAAIVQHQGRILTLLQPLRIVLILQGERSQFLLLQEPHLPLSRLHCCIHLPQCLL